MHLQQKNNKNFIILTVAFTVLMLGLILGICWVLKSKQEPAKEDTSKTTTSTTGSNN
ncbi:MULTISPECIES: hypothetical protein [16SrI (Aster yellows group)]|uniref:Uncharacterized protein n=2 Tax=16SrI (Aster yellows group) TaxID=3042590 RepID=A0A859IBR7_9MOLU|nr:hypothetical protein [Chrysanthemum yellows phytoplasma]QKX95545.1 MAG: hypothetical protein RP166_5670 [Rapeseed phyllody phytoplasma]